MKKQINNVSKLNIRFKVLNQTIPHNRIRNIIIYIISDPNLPKTPKLM